MLDYKDGLWVYHCTIISNFLGFKIFQKIKGGGAQILKAGTQQNYIYHEKTELFSTKSLVPCDIKFLPETLELLAHKKQPRKYSKHSIFFKCIVPGFITEFLFCVLLL